MPDRVLFISAPDAVNRETCSTKGKQRAAAVPHTKAPAGLSQPARRFPGSRLRAFRPRFSRGSTIITAVLLFTRSFALGDDEGALAPLSLKGHGGRGAGTTVIVPGVPI